MAEEIDPIIERKLLAFRGRYRLLLLLRGLGCAGLFFLASLLTVAAVDYNVVMEDPTRYWLSGGMYFIGLLAFWFFCARPLWRRLEPASLAAMIEEQSPELRAQLLAAVELSGDGEGMDSAALRRRARERVIGKLQRVNTAGLMPPRLKQTCLLAAALALAFAGGTGWMAAKENGRMLLLRALAPMANIDRVSQNKITILNPAGGDATVPENATQPIEIQVAGPALEDRPRLETRVVGGPKPGETSTEMKQSAGETYTAAVKVGRHELEYRIFAGDAVSRWFTLQSVPRPRVEKFVKEYFYPKYMSRPPKVEHADTGDLNEIIGTAVELTIALDQSVAEAKLHMVTPSATNVLDFAPADEPTEWTLRLPELAESGAYTVHLKTAGGLENIYRPEHAITARADLMPTIKVAKPKGSLTTRPEDILTVEGEAEDDVGLRRVEQLIRVNQQDWTTNVLQLAQLPGTNVTITLDWDLLKLDAKPGDLVLAKLAAIDLKGSRAESSPVRLKVDSAIFEAQRLAAIGRQQQWTTNLVAAAEATIEFHAALPADLKKFIEPANDASRLKQAAEALRRLDAARAQWKRLHQRLPSIARQANAGRETAGLSLLGRVALRMDADWLSRGRLHLAPLGGTLVNAREQAHAGQLPPVLAEVTQAAAQLRATANGWLAADEAALALDLLDYISRAAAKMHRLAEADRDIDPKVWERLSRRQGSVAKDLEVALATLKPLAGRLPGAHGGTIQSLHAELVAAQQAFLEQRKNAADENRLPAGRSLENAVAAAAAKLRPMIPALADAAAKARTALEKTVGPTADAVNRLQAALDAHEQAAKEYDEAVKAAEKVDQAKAQRDVAGELLEVHWLISGILLRGRARLEETSKANALFVSDTAQAARAVEAVRAGVEAGRDLRVVVVQLEGIAKAMATLEAAHELTVLEEAVKALAARERWKKKSTDANTLRPRDWQWLRQRLALTPDQLRAAGLAGAAHVEAAASGQDAQAVGDEMSRRKQKPGVFPVEKKSK